jgi:Sro7p-like protein associated with Golgi transport
MIPPLHPTSDSSTRTVRDISNSTTASTKTFLTALILNAAIAGAEIAAFTIVRRYFRIVYEPRSLSASKACAHSLMLLCPVLIFV